MKIPDAPPGLSESVSGGKVLRRKIADIPIADREYAKEKLREFTEAITGPRASVECKNMRIFCRVRVPHGYVAFLEKYQTRVDKDLSSIGKLRVSLADLSNTGFGKFSFLGYLAEGVGSEPPWSSVGRLFADENGNLVYLLEWDFVSDEGGIEQAEEFMNAKVGPFDGSAMRSISSVGYSLWVLDWVEIRKQIKLYYLCKSKVCVSESGFIALANSIYK